MCRHGCGVDGSCLTTGSVATVLHALPVYSNQPAGNFTFSISKSMMMMMMVVSVSMVVFDRGLCVKSDAIGLNLVCWRKTDILNTERDCETNSIDLKCLIMFDDVKFVKFHFFVQRNMVINFTD